MNRRTQPDRNQALPGVEGLTAEKLPPENKVFDHAERGLEGVAVAEIMGLFGQGQLGLGVLQQNRASGDRKQARDHPQQRGLA